MRQKRILSQKRPAAGGEARERASFLEHREMEGGNMGNGRRKYGKRRDDYPVKGNGKGI